MINKIMVAAVAWLSMTAVFPIYAQQPKTHTLGNLWPKVEANYPGVGARTTAIDAAEFRERAAKSNMLPQINAQAQNSYGTYEGSAGAFFPQAGFFNVSGATDAGNASTMASNSFGSATVTWELFSFGRRHKGNKAANALFHQSVSDKDAYLISLKKTLSERYINLLYNLAKLNWAKENAQRLNEIRKVTAGLSAAGLKPAADSLLASSAYVQAKGEHDKWQGLEQAASIYLQELFSGESVDLNISPNRLIRPTASLSFGKKAMARSHPVLDVLDQQARYYSLMGQVQTKSRLPSLRFLGGYAFRGTAINPEGTASEAWKDGFNNPTNNVLVGVGITWNITGLHTHRLKSQAYFKEAERADFLHTQYAQAMQAELSASQAKILQQYAQLQKTRLAVQQAQDAYHMYLARYKSGLIALSELLQIRILLEQAENTHIEASSAYWMLLPDEAALTADFDFLFNNL